MLFVVDKMISNDFANAISEQKAKINNNHLLNKCL